MEQLSPNPALLILIAIAFTAYRGQEMMEAVLEGKQSAVGDKAEN